MPKIIKIDSSMQKVLEENGSVTVKFVAGSAMAALAKVNAHSRRFNNLQDRKLILQNDWLRRYVMPHFSVQEFPR